MNELDQYAKHVLKVKYYARYVDDIVCIDNCGSTLDKKYDMISSFAKEKLKLELHPHKKEINKVEHDINFVGYIIKPYCKYTRRSTIINLHKKVRLISSDLTKLRATVNSYFGMLIHTNSYNIRLRFTEEHQNLTFDNKLRKMILQ
jgi:RNA-directed DNA polymerase